MKKAVLTIIIIFSLLFLVTLVFANPIITSFSPNSTNININEGEPQDFIITTTYPDSGTTTYNWSLYNASNFSLINNSIITDNLTTSTFTFSPSYNDSGTYILFINISDNNSTNSTFWNIIVNNNTAPNITSYQPTNLTPEVNEGSDLYFSVNASDPNNNTLTYSCFLDNAQQATIGEYTYQPDYTASGHHNVTIIVSDGEFQDSLEWDVTVNNTNGPPTIDSFIPTDTTPEMEFNETLQFSINASDPDGDNLTYLWLYESLNVSIESSYSFHQPTTGTFNITIIVSDTNNNTDYQYWDVTVTNEYGGGSEGSSGGGNEEPGEEAQPTGPVCGNGVCESGEDYITCLEDCEEPAEEPEIFATSCEENWTCSNWSECKNSTQNKTCIDQNGCGTTNNKPEEEQECNEKTFFSFITGAVIGTIKENYIPISIGAGALIAIIATLLIIMKKNKKKKKKKKNKTRMKKYKRRKKRKPTEKMIFFIILGILALIIIGYILTLTFFSQDEEINYECPEQESISCMPPVAENLTDICSGSYHDWIIDNCNVSFSW